MIARLLPARIRFVIYTTLATAWGLELVWDLVPDPLEGKVLASLSVLGFTLAATRTSDYQGARENENPAAASGTQPAQAGASAEPEPVEYVEHAAGDVERVERKPRCADGAVCHHRCAEQDRACWRRTNAGPLPGVFAGDRWPPEVEGGA